MQLWWAEETFKNIKNLTDPKLLNSSVSEILNFIQYIHDIFGLKMLLHTADEALLFSVCLAPPPLQCHLPV